VRDLDDPQDYGSIVRNNLMKRPGYAPYCGGCNRFDRATWDGQQFRHTCGWRSDFPADFIALYAARWHNTEAQP
jgi:hypothetical protein